MARYARRHPRNAPGDLYVDTTCIDCSTCTRLAPNVFGLDESTQHAYVRDQPQGSRAQQRAMMALLSCPVGAIGTCSRPDLAAAIEALPTEIAPGVYDCGYTSRDSFGAASWLIRRDDGNVLVDSPRATSSLFRRLDALGGVKTMVLTHRDDVADHEAFHARYGCDRVMHVCDAMFDAEVLVESDDEHVLSDGLRVVPVPGHTRGSIALHVDDQYLFTGDHLWADGGGQLVASRCLCWWSWQQQLQSMERLRGLTFSWVLPGHGYPFRALSPRAMLHALDCLIERMQHMRC